MANDSRVGAFEKLVHRSRVVGGGVAAFLVTYALVAGITGGGPEGSPFGLILASITASSAVGVATVVLGPTAGDTGRPTLWAATWSGVAAYLAWNVLVLLTAGLDTAGSLLVVPLAVVAAVVASILW